MKSKRIINSWNKIEPDKEAQKRMLSNVLSHVKRSASFAGKEKMSRKIFGNMRVLSLLLRLLLFVRQLLSLFYQGIRRT